MIKHILTVVFVTTLHAAFAQEANQWSTYYADQQVQISTQYSDCHYPEKGVHNRYLLLKIENLTAEPLSVSYQLNRAYNGNALTPDKSAFSFTINGQSAIEASCHNLKSGLHLFSKMLANETQSVLSGFELTQLTINGKSIAQ